MAILQQGGFYLKIDNLTLSQQFEPAVIFNFIQGFNDYLERHQLVVLWKEIYLAHYDPTILAVCLIYDRELWLNHGIERLIEVGRCTSNYVGDTNEIVEVFTLPSLIRCQS